MSDDRTPSPDGVAGAAVPVADWRGRDERRDDGGGAADLAVEVAVDGAIVAADGVGVVVSSLLSVLGSIG